MVRSAATVSCVIPVFNGERFIREAIDSVRAQTVPVQEIIVVDDGSQDGTANVVRNLGSDVIYEHQRNQGAPAARNRGAARATGRFIAFLDADDLWTEHKIARQLETMHRDPEVGGCTTYMQNFWMPDVEEELEGQSNERLTAPQPGVASSVLLRSAVYNRIGPLDHTLRHRDIQDWLIRMRSAGWKLETLDEVLVRRRIHNRNVSRNRNDRGEQELLRLAAAALTRRRQGPGK